MAMDASSRTSLPLPTPPPRGMPANLHGPAVLAGSPRFTPGFTLRVAWGFFFCRKKSQILTLTDPAASRNVSKP